MSMKVKLEQLQLKIDIKIEISTIPSDGQGKIEATLFSLETQKTAC